MSACMYTHFSALKLSLYLGFYLVCVQTVIVYVTGQLHIQDEVCC